VLCQCLVLALSLIDPLTKGDNIIARLYHMRRATSPEGHVKGRQVNRYSVTAFTVMNIRHSMTRHTSSMPGCSPLLVFFRLSFSPALPALPPLVSVAAA
jgi:hypothetical protein